MPLFRSFLALGLLFAATTLQAQLTFSQRSYGFPDSSVGDRSIAADFTSDGKPDLLLLGANIVILPNAGDGTFDTAREHRVDVSVDLYSGDAAVLDFNRDGKLDVVACWFRYPYGTTFGMTVWFGSGNGTFSGRVDLSGRCSSVAVADFNRDGNPDITNEGSVYLGNGAGGVAQQVTISSTPFVSSDGRNCRHVGGGIVAADFTGDGRPDLARSGRCELFGVESEVLLLGTGSGDGHFTFTVAGDHRIDGKDPRVDDVDQDGRADIIGDGPSDRPSSFGYLRNNGNGTFTWRPVASFDAFLYAGGFLDLDGDGIKDALVTLTDHPNSPEYSAYRVKFFRGAANGTFREIQTWPNLPVLSFTWADFDRDGRADLSLAYSFIPFDSVATSTLVWLNRTASAPTCAAPSSVRTLALCIPATLAGSELHLLSNATHTRPLAAYQVYIDGSLRFVSPDDWLNKKFTLSPGTHRITARAWDSLGAFSATKNVTVSSGSGCTNTSNRTVLICTPLNGAIATDPVHIVAKAATSNSFRELQVYVDGFIKHRQASNSLDTYLPMSQGTHRVTVKGWDSAGSFSSTINIIVNGAVSQCVNAVNRSVQVCSPVQDSLVNSPVRVLAAVNDSANIIEVQVYVDGVIQHRQTSKTVDVFLPVAIGSRRVTVKAWDSAGAFASSVMFAVQ